MRPLPDARASATWPPADPAELDRLHFAAKEHANELRREAISEFWRSTEQWIAEAAQHTRRAGDRLAARLRQRSAM